MEGRDEQGAGLGTGVPHAVRDTVIRDPLSRFVSQLSLSVVLLPVPLTCP